MPEPSGSNHHDWYKTLPLIIAGLAMIASAVAAYSAFSSAKSAARSSAAAEKNAAIAEKQFQLQRGLNEPRIWFVVTAQPELDVVALQISNRGAPVSITSWGFIVRRSAPPENKAYTSFESALTDNLFDERQVHFVRHPSPLEGMPRTLDRNESITIMIDSSMLKHVPPDVRKQIFAIGFATSTSDFYGTANDATQKFLQHAMPDEYTPLTVDQLKGSFPLPGEKRQSDGGS